MKKYEKTTTPTAITASTLERLVDLWELTTDSKDPNISIVRGWLMDELERRNPDGFNAWLERPAPEDKDLRADIFR